MDERPELDDCQTGDEIRRWYWLKEELVEHCRRVGLPYAGSKAQITERLAHWLDTGEVLRPASRNVKSGFDWHSETLTPSTIITDSYRNTQNVRRFMKHHYGPNFTFNIAFMKWMKENVGKTLADSVVARREIAQQEKLQKPEIPEGNQYNRYTRDFFDANPHKTVAEARACWAYKRSLPGHNRYEKCDLVALDKT